MPFQLTLYRAADGLPPLIEWDQEHRQPLGTKSQLRLLLDAALAGLKWSDHGVLWSASGPWGGEEHAFELSLYGRPDEELLDFRIYASPPPIRVIMRALGLNYCFSMDSCKLYYPFEAGDCWPKSTGAL
jgi:hypothetical protein